MYADPRQYGRGRYRATGGGNPARGHNWTRLLSLQHKAINDTLVSDRGIHI